ncbi:hypothetical protein ACFODZ_04450 [Marinicella sediminis]|uniref:MoaD/ThiS family protein n=1 Tax=Marinicella sediminis TaxID=1792834 RepID=A0ABV7JBA3_9GAMM|nr:hypothetical protein [Marinicella sediminis]
MNKSINITLEFYGRLQSQFSDQPLKHHTVATNVLSIYLELCTSHQQPDESRIIKPIINDAFCDWQDCPKDNDTVGFFPPASGG